MPFARLWSDAGAWFFASALRRTGSPQLAEEVTQNVFSLLARKAAGLSGHRSITSWLFSVTKYESANAMRSQRRHNRKLTSLAQDLRGEEASLESHSEAENWKDALSHLDESLDRLSRAERDVLCARFFEEKSYREIAQNFGKSESACKMQVKRIMAKLSPRQVSQIEVAYLTDRVLLAEGKKQVYGTQVGEDYKPRSLEDEENVDKRKAAVGLPPLAEYLEEIESFYERAPREVRQTAPF